MQTFNEFLNKKNNETYSEFFKNKKQLNLYVNEKYFIIDQDNQIIINKPIYDYLHNPNPVHDLAKDLATKELGFFSFSHDELQKIFFLFLNKNSSKELQKYMSPWSAGILKADLSKNNSFLDMVMDESFTKKLINNLDIYKNDKAKILDIFDFITRLLIFRLDGEDLVKIILFIDDKDLEYVFQKLHDDRVGRKLNMDNLFDIINAKSSAPTSYFERLLNAFVSNRNTDDREIKILQKFIEDYNKNNPKDPINPINFEDLRLKNFTKRLPSATDLLKSIGTAAVSSITNSLRRK